MLGGYSEGKTEGCLAGELVTIGFIDSGPKLGVVSSIC
jgi:hypothetical protein